MACYGDENVVVKPEVEGVNTDAVRVLNRDHPESVSSKRPRNQSPGLNGGTHGFAL